MDGNKILSKLNTLTNIKKMKDVKPLTNFIFPGKHCPLMGSALAVRGIKGAMMMVIGTQECTYYTKSMTMHTNEFGGLDGRCVSVTVDTNDVTFGSVNKTEKAFDEMYEEYKPTCVFLVTTCVIEIIGDDFDALAESLSAKYDIPVMAVHTEHFKSEDHMPGIEKTITACIDMMEDHEKDGSVNVLGQRLGNFSDTELYRVLGENDIKIGLMVPSGCEIDDIKVASKASVNVIVHPTALPLAKKMKKKFGTPYVLFERTANPEKTKLAYSDLFEFLGKKMPENLENLYQEAVKCVETSKSDLEGIRYMYSHTPYNCFDLNDFMCSLGMVPTLLQISSLTAEDETHKANIEAKFDPYVSTSANIAPIGAICEVLDPHLYLGHAFVQKLREQNVVVVSVDRANSLLGYEATSFIMNALVNSAKDSISLREKGEV